MPLRHCIVMRSFQQKDLKSCLATKQKRAAAAKRESNESCPQCYYLALCDIMVSCC